MTTIINNRVTPSLLIAIFFVSPYVEHAVMAQDKPQPVTSIGTTIEAGSDRVIVKYRSSSAALVSGQLHGLSRAEVIKRLPFINADVLRVPEGSSLDEIIAWYEERPDVEYAEPDYRVFPIGGIAAATTPDDVQYVDQYHLNNTGQTGGTADADVDAPEAWDITTGDSTIIVAVIDTGIDTEHPDLLANMWVNEREIAGDSIDNDGNGFVDDIHGWDFANDDNSVFDGTDEAGRFYDSHGTHVAGTIGAVSNNGIGVAGVAWNVRIMSLKFLHGGGYTSDAVDALAYAKAHGAKFTSNSWGGGGDSQALKDAITEHGGLFIAAAGNAGRNTDTNPFYPAASDLDLIISVAATDYDDGRAGFSNYGEVTVDLGAPGVSILATWPEDEYNAISGTSMATPIVSGTAVLVYAQFPDLSTSAMKARLMFSGDMVTALDGKTVSGRRLNALNSMEDDQVKPSAVTDLVVAADPTPIINPMAGRHLMLEWTSSGDDGTSGRAASYDVRYSTEPITEATFSSALQVTGVPLPQLAGMTEKVAASGLNPFTDYYFAVKVSDNVGNVSDLSNEATAKTLSIRTLFADDAETTASDALWSADAPWVRTTESFSQGSYSWTDSPGEGIHYENNLDISLTSVPFSLADATRSTLKFDHHYAIENGYDFAYVEASSTGGLYWERLKTFGGWQGEWTGVTVDLSSFDGEPEVMIRFRLVTDHSYTYDGWWVDDIQISADNIGLLTTDVSANESGDTLVVGLGLKNEGFEVAGVSYQMQWPDPANLVTYVGVTETERVSGLTHSISLDEVNNSVTGILIDTGLEKTVASGTGALVEYRFALTNDLTNAEAAVTAEAHPDGIRAGLPRVFYEVAFNLHALSLSNLDGNPVSAGGRGGRWEKDILNADVDFSGVVDVTDVVSTIDHFLGKVGFNRVQQLVADTFLDSIINVVDVVRAINIILGRCIGVSECAADSSVASAPALTASRHAGEEVSDRDLDILLQSNAGPNSTQDRNTLNVVADIPPDVVGLQLGIEYDPSRVRVSGARLLLEDDGFELAQNIGPSGATFMIYSPTSASLPADTQAVIALELEATTGGVEPSAADFQLAEVLGVDAVGMPVYPGISPTLAVEDLLGTPNLTSSQRVQLDRRGNRDGVFNLGDLLALLHRSGLLGDGAGLDDAWRAPRQGMNR